MLGKHECKKLFFISSPKLAYAFNIAGFYRY